MALFERLSDRPGDTGYRLRLTARQPAEVMAKLEALERGARRATRAMPTQFPGSGTEGDFPAPDQVGPFRLTDPLGEGGMGKVWKGQRNDGLFDQTVAVKLLHGHLVRLAGSRFAEERRLLAKLEHPGIARLIDGGVLDNGTPYLVMEYVAGRAIDEVAEGLTERARVELVLQGARAVQFAHEHLIVHADLKPSNLMVDSDGRVRLLDFGIGRLLGEEHGGEALPMTTDFASPARLAGAAPVVADDVFALGEVLARLIRETKDGDLTAVITKARHPDPANRYGSVASLIAELERWRTGFPVQAQPDSVTYRARRFIGRHRVGVALSTAAALVLTATAVVATTNYVRAERERREAETRFLEVRDLSRFMLFDLYDDLADSPGTVGSRARLAQTAGRYLERLQRVPDAPTDLRVDIIKGWRRLAAVEGLTGNASLGDPKAALKALDNAEAEVKIVLAKDPKNASALEELGWIETGRWTLQPAKGTGTELNTHAADLFAQSLRLDPRREGARLGIITLLKNKAYDLIWADKPAQALPLLNDALRQLRDRPVGPALAREAASLEVSLLGRLGDATYYAGDKSGSLTWYLEQEAFAQAQLAKKRSPVWIAHLAYAEFNVSSTLQDIPGRSGEALDHAQAGVRAIEAALSFGDDANLEEHLLVLKGQESLVLADLGRMDEAVLASERSIALRESRLAQVPKDAQRSRELAVALPNHAVILEKSRRNKEACAAANRAVALWQGIQARGELGARDAKVDVPDAKARATQYCG